MVDGQEVAEELAQAVSLGILVAVLGHLFEQRFGLGLDGSQLVYHGSVEHFVGIFLIGKYPFVLAPAHAGPTAYGVAG